MLLAAILVAGTALPAHAQVSRSRTLFDADDIAAAIETSGAGWTAAETGISGLAPAERQRLLGTLTDPAIPAAMQATQPLPVGGELPSSLDWRDLDGDFTTPVRHQLSCGSCWAFATVGALESMVEIAADDPEVDLDLSEQELINCTDGDCVGAYLDETLDHLVHAGVTSEACQPYQATDALPCDDSCDHLPPTHAAGWVTVAEDVASIKHRLQYGPVIAGMKVYRDFFYYTEGVYRHVTDTLSGYHAVVIVGYDDDDEAWIIKNSWGTDWGEDTYGVTGQRGWFRMAYGDSCLMPGYIYAIEADEESEPPPESLFASMVLDDPGPYAPGDVVLIRLTVHGGGEQTTPFRVLLTTTDPWGGVRTLIQTPVMHTVPGEPLELELPVHLNPGTPSGDYELLARIRGAEELRIDLVEGFSVEVDLV
jgi:hypothetical protein